MIQEVEVPVEMLPKEEEQPKVKNAFSRGNLDSFILSNKTNDSTTKEPVPTSNVKLLNKKRPAKSKANQSVIREKKNYNTCFVCKKRGDLILCDGCPKSFHMVCINLEAVDQDQDWFCESCLIKRDKSVKGQPSKSKRGMPRSKPKVAPHINGNKNHQNGTPHVNKENNFNSHDKIVSLLENTTVHEEQEQSNLNFSKELNLNDTIINYDGNKLLNASPDQFLEDLTFDQLNNLDIIIEEIIKKGRIHSYVREYIKRSFNSNTDAYKSKQSKKKKKKKKKANTLTQTKLTKFQFKDTPKKTSKPVPKDSILESKRKDQERKRQEEIARKIEEKKYQNVRYPIDDKELYGKWKRYKLEEKYLKKHEPSKLLIPNSLFIRVYKIYDFFHTFSEVLKISIDFSVEMLYLSLLNTNIKQCNIVRELIVSMLSVLIDETKSLEYNEETPEELSKDEFLFKTLFKNTKWKKVLVLGVCFTSYAKTLAATEKYSSMCTPELTTLINRICNTECYFFFEESIQDKLILINFLINCCLSTEAVRTLIQDHILKKVDLKKEKFAIEADLRLLETKKKDYERIDKRDRPSEKIAELNIMLSKLTEENENLGRKEIQKLRKELEANRDQLKIAIKEVDDNENKRLKLVSKLDKIASDISSLSNCSQRTLGVDGLGNKYFIFKGKNNLIRVHVKMPNNDWGVYTSEKHIEELLLTLSDKGKAEKQLKEKLRNINPKYFTTPTNDPLVNSVAFEQFDNWKNARGVKVTKEEEVIFNSPTNDYNEIVVNLISTSLTSIEQAFTENLFKDNKEWDFFEVRQDFLAYTRNVNDARSFAKLLLLMNESFSSPLFISKKRNNYSKIIEEDETNELKPCITDNFNNLNPYYKAEFSNINEFYRKLQSKTYIWKDYDESSLESHFIEKLETATTLTEILVLSQLFVSVVSGWILSFNKSHNWRLKDVIDLREKESNLEINLENFANPSNDRQLRIRKQANTPNLKQGELAKKSIDWSDECMICDEGGKILLCENCSNAAHMDCIGLTKEPNEWFCEDCLHESSRKGITRSCIRNK